MKVNHLHLMVPGLSLASACFEKYFELHSSGGSAGLTRRGPACSFHVQAPGGFLVEVGA